MISKDKKYKTRGNREVRIYATDGGGTYPVHGAISTDGDWATATWTKSGKHDKYVPKETRFDLIEDPKDHTFDIYLFERHDGTVYTVSRDPLLFSSYPPISYHKEGIKLLSKKRITFTEGEGI